MALTISSSTLDARYWPGRLADDDIGKASEWAFKVTLGIQAEIFNLIILPILWTKERTCYGLLCNLIVRNQMYSLPLCALYRYTHIAILNQWCTSLCSQSVI